MSSSLPPRHILPESGASWPPPAPEPLPLLAAQVALTLRPGWDGEAPEPSAEIAALAESVVLQLEQLPAEKPLGLAPAPNGQAPEEWERNGQQGGFSLTDLIWFG